MAKNIIPGNDVLAKKSVKTPQRTHAKISKALKLLLMNNDMKFMNNFDPERSNREKRKLTRKFLTEGKKYISGHDESGVSNSSEKDICDCLTEECPGCHFPCPKCRSCKCGADCRVNRKWTYDTIENEGEVANTKTKPTTNCCILHS